MSDKTKGSHLMKNSGTLVKVSVAGKMVKVDEKEVIDLGTLKDHLIILHFLFDKYFLCVTIRSIEV